MNSEPKSPITCPKCGRGVFDNSEDGSSPIFWCGTDWSKGILRESNSCLQNQIKSIQEENTRLRAALAQSPGACHYCQLPKDEWSKCKSGFPGCARANDAFGCPELGAMVEYAHLRDLCCELITEWESPARDGRRDVSAHIESIREAIGYSSEHDSK